MCITVETDIEVLHWTMSRLSSNFNLPEKALSIHAKNLKLLRKIFYGKIWSKRISTLILTSFKTSLNMQSNVEINLFIYRELNPIEMLWVKCQNFKIWLQAKKRPGVKWISYAWMYLQAIWTNEKGSGVALVE